MGTRVVAYDSRRCCGRRRVVASDVYPVSLPAAGDATELAVRAGEFSNAFAGTCAICRKQAPGRPDMPVAGRRVCPVMRGPANAGRSRRCPAPSVWLCMPPHTRRNGSPKAIPLVPICRACRVCGLVLAGSRTGCAMGLPRLGPSCLFGCGWWLAVVPRVCEKGRGHAVVSPPFQGLGAAACYSPTPFRVQYHRRARS